MYSFREAPRDVRRRIAEISLIRFVISSRKSKVKEYPHRVHPSGGRVNARDPQRFLPMSSCANRRVSQEVRAVSEQPFEAASTRGPDAPDIGQPYTVSTPR